MTCPEVRIVVRPYATSLVQLRHRHAPARRHRERLASSQRPTHAFLARDAFGATGLGLFATSWLALSRAVGLYEFGFAFAITLLAVAALGGKPLIEGDLHAQLRELADEAGVRKTL